MRYGLSVFVGWVTALAFGCGSTADGGFGPSTGAQGGQAGAQAGGAGASGTSAGSAGTNAAGTSGSQSSSGAGGTAGSTAAGGDGPSLGGASAAGAPALAGAGGASAIDYEACRATESEVDCMAAGGTWGPVGIVEATCICPAPDAGETCTQNSDCEGLCTVDDLQECATLTEGYCSAVAPIQDCYCIFGVGGVCP